jgi:hypothetical protein
VISSDSEETWKALEMLAGMQGWQTRLMAGEFLWIDKNIILNI